MENTENQITNPEPISVGQVLYREKRIRNQPSEIEEVTVGKVGKKYFYLTGWQEKYPINKETLEYKGNNYSHNNFQLYRDKQEILDRKEKSSLRNKLQKHFNWSGNGSGNTLEQLRKAAEILGITN
jgi:hypothetical protein